MSLNIIWFVPSYIVWFVLAILIITIVIVCQVYSTNPFLSLEPQIKFTIDITGKRNVRYNDYIADWIVDHKNDNFKRRYVQALVDFDYKSEKYLNGLFKRHRRKQYILIRDKVESAHYSMFKFEFVRVQTKYKQQNYVRHPYKDAVVYKVVEFTLNELLNKQELLMG